MVAKIFYSAVQLFTSAQSWQTVQAYYDEEGHELPGSVQDYIEESLPILTWSILISKVMRIPLALLYLKYPSATRTFFVFELFINAQETFLMSPHQPTHINSIYMLLILNYILLTLFDHGKMLVA